MAKQNNSDLQERKRLLTELNLLEARLGESLTKISSTTAANTENLTKAINGALAAVKDLENSASGLYEQLRGITSEFGKQLTPLGKVRGALRGLEREAAKLRDDEQGITDLTRLQVEALQRKVKVYNNALKQEKQNLELLQTAATVRGKINHEVEAALHAINDEESALKRLVIAARARLKEEKAISKNMGVTGALVEGTGALMERLGMRSGIFHDAMQDSAEAMRLQSKLAGENANLFDRMKISAKGLGILIRGFGQGLKDPVVITGALLDAFLDVNKASVEFGRLTGQNAVRISGMNSRLATSVDFLEQAAELTKQTGLAATSIFSPDDIANMAEAKNLLGLSADQAGLLGIRSKVAGVNIDAYKEGIVQATNTYNDLNNNVVAHGVVMQDVLNTSDGIALSLGGNPKRIAKAAAAARSLGQELSKVDDIASSLMNFADSIGNELEAQLLTGKNINLAKARELALNNDLEGLSAELARNGASAAEFASMNRIQQEALAKALGMSRDDLGKMAQQQLLSKNATLAQQAAARGVTVEQMEQMNIQEKLQKSLGKLAQAFAPILDIVTPIVSGIADITTMIAGALATGVGKFVGYLATGLAILNTTQTTMATIMAIQARMTTSKVVELGLGGKILSVLGFQNVAKAYANSMQLEGNAMSAIRAGFEQTILGSMIMQGAALVKSVARGAVLLAQTVARAAAELLANSALTFGIGAAIAVAAAGAAFAGYRAMTADDMVSPAGYGDRVLSGPEGSIQLNNKDTVVAGTDLFSGGSGGSMSTAKLEAKLDRLIALVSKGGDVILDGNKVGSALVMGSYKSS